MKLQFNWTKEKGPKKVSSKLFWKGFLMNVLNPKVTIFFLAFFPGFLFSDEMNIVSQFLYTGITFYADCTNYFWTYCYFWPVPFLIFLEKIQERACT
ncbi:LysE family translocator [Flagellimonas eckloniae]|uniref:LysE family translocator n=1 Tax=Flagellimonas eckloniae TaxID=346185 RepID=UPI0021CDCD59|nr:LysE family transporter [Allomuricauda eckloniae]